MANKCVDSAVLWTTQEANREYLEGLLTCEEEARVETLE